MNGKELIQEALDLSEKVLSEIKDSGALDGDSLMDELIKACESLENVKNRPTLRTRNGTNMAFPVKEAAQNLTEAWEDFGDGEGLNELTAMMAEFVDSAGVLVGSMRGRTVIMT